MTKPNSFLKNSYITLVRQFTSIVIGTLLIIIIARMLGPELQGNYALITNFPAILMMFINLGINISTVYYVSRQEIDPGESFFNNLIIGVVLSLIGIIAGFISIYFFGDKLFKDLDDYSYVYFILIAIPFMLLNTFFQTIFQGIQDFKVFNTILVITQITNLLLVVVLIVLFDFGLMGALIAFISGHALTLLFILVFSVKRFNLTRKNLRLNIPYLRKSFHYGFKSYMSNLVTFMNYRINIYLLGFFVGNGAVGLYFTALTLGEKLSVFTQSISSVLLPRIAAMGTEEERNHLTSIVSRFTLVFMLVLSVVIFFTIDFLAPVLGHEYKETPFFLKILLPGIALLAVEKILSNDIAARGKPEINMYVSIFNVIFSTILNVFLIPMYGATGAAIATSISYSLSFIIKAVFFKRVTGEAFNKFLLFKREDFSLVKKMLLRQKFFKRLIRS
ncbi:flippase [Mesobacillus sp. AQ2]|uniref:flippase n=1 Tax=Bacillaceae TaxID=186817 RepID=UPI0011A791FE|nr:MULTISPECIES: flippase [Bacillaceae]WHX40245.1 flippase [Mesobacillus sp. AQ2]